MGEGQRWNPERGEMQNAVERVRVVTSRLLSQYARGAGAG